MNAAPPSLEGIALTKRFGGFTALDAVDIRVGSGEVHALLGENGAGKSTLVKCLIGYHRADEGAVLIDGHEHTLANPRDAHALGVGMVYQHFTLVPSMTVAENLVMSRPNVPAVIDWKAALDELESFLDGMPFKVPLRRPVAHLAAGERQKTEILKQLYLRRRFLILDEPTSVLTPDEADEMLTLLRDMAAAGDLSILLITHKFREVTAYADRVTVLRQGKLAGTGAVAELGREDMAAMMIGQRSLPESSARTGAPETGAPVLEVNGLKLDDDAGLKSVEVDGLAVHRHEIVGVAGVSGNGQRELVEALAGQRTPAAGHIRVQGQDYAASRREAHERRVRCLPEEPLRNACAPRMSVAENLGFRRFDRQSDGTRRYLLDFATLAGDAIDLIRRYRVKTASKDSAISTLSGGNVQRAVLARELSDETDLLIVANPCFGLDFTAVAEIRSRIMEARNRGAAVLLVSEDLDELLELSDRIVVMSEGRIVYETGIDQVDVHEIGARMAGHH